MTPNQLATQVVGWQVAFSAGSALTLYFLMPALMLLVEDEQRTASLTLSLAVLVGGCLSIFHGWALVWARRHVLTALTGRQENPDQQLDLPKLNDDPWRIVNGWLYCGLAAVVISMTLLRPFSIPAESAVTLAVFSSIILAAASLPLFLLIRRDFVLLMEQVPPESMAEVIDNQVRSGRLRGRTSRRLLAAMATPVAFLAIGNALIAGAHVRSLEQRMRSETARSVVSAVLKPLPREEQLGLRPDHAQRTLAALSESGFRARILSPAPDAASGAVGDGVMEMFLPLGTIGAQVRFYGTTAWAVSPRAFPIALLALIAALWAGIALARLLSRDLRMANHGVRMLGTDAALEGTRVMRPARFRAVADLGTAIESLAHRFRLFAQAQERAIAAKSSATKARGRFFASVSHDLKSPLNSILGFAEITRRDPMVSRAQQESLDTIVQRGSELLTLIETILDAARVEAGQLHLEMEDVDVPSLLEEALNKAQTLTAERDVLVRFDVPDDVPKLTVDRLRLAQAMATFIGHARRTAERDSMRILVETEPRPPKVSLTKRKVSIYIEIPSTRFSASELEGMLNPEMHPGQHRGLSLALRLAKSVIELHGGRIAVTGRTVREPAFAIFLQGRAGQ